MVSIVEWCESNWGFSPPSYVDSWHFRSPFWITMWTIGEVVAAKIYKDVRQLQEDFLLHHRGLRASSVWLAYHFVKSGFSFKDYVLTSYEFPGTFEHHILNISMSYFVVDLPRHRVPPHLHRAPPAVHRGVHGHPGYLRYWPSRWTSWRGRPRPPWRLAPEAVHADWFGQDPLESDKQMQLLMGGFNGVFNLWMASWAASSSTSTARSRARSGDAQPRPLCADVHLLQVLPVAHVHQALTRAARTRTAFHFIGGGLETGLFLTNLHFL